MADITSKVCFGPHRVEGARTPDPPHDLVRVFCGERLIGDYDLGPRGTFDRSDEIRLAVNRAMTGHEQSVLVDLLGECVTHIDNDPDLLARITRVIEATTLEELEAAGEALGSDLITGRA